MNIDEKLDIVLSKLENIENDIEILKSNSNCEDLLWEIESIIKK